MTWRHTANYQNRTAQRVKKWQLADNLCDFSAIILARVLGFVEVIDLNPRGTIFFPELVQEVVKRYKFQKFPQTLEEFDESKGVEFHQGKAGDKIIQKLVIWNTLFVLETRSNTTDSKQILEEMLAWGAEKFGLNFKPGMITRFAYVSDLTFHSEAPLLSVSPAITNLAARTGAAVSEIWHEPIQYDPMILTVGHDPNDTQEFNRCIYHPTSG